MQNSGNAQKVQLGCGTLILIALIVLFFSSSGNRYPGLESDINKLRNDISSLQTDVAQLRQAIQSQSNQLTAIQNKLDKTADK
jgi:hypothetical protein